MPIEVTGNGLMLDGELLPIYSGTIHYWRLEKKLWSKILDNVKKMGFKVVETYIPWGIHEIEDGGFDFGQVNENNDLDTFLNLCEQKGFKILVRPGPHINAEMTMFGYPERIIYDQEIYARTPWGTPVVYPYFSKQFPIPSYASEKFYNESEKYFDALAPILLKHQYPQGGIVALQSDNETCYFFRDRPYVMDYSKDSIDLYRTMLKSKYSTIENLNNHYGTQYENFDTVVAPKGFKGAQKEDLPYYFDWVEYKEYQIIYALTRVARMWKARGINIPIYHNIAYQYYTPADLIATEQTPEIDIMGIDAYPNREKTKGLREKVRYMAGSSKLPFIPEYSSGVWFDHERTFLPDEEEFTTMYAFMNGLKAINYYMIVERERWQGSPITRDNRIREKYFDFYTRFNKFLYTEELYNFERNSQILVMRNFEIGRFKALFSLLDLSPFISNSCIKGLEIPPLLFKPRVDLGFKYIDSNFEHWSRENWIDDMFIRLLKENLDFNHSDTHLSLEQMKKYKVIFASTYDFMDKTEQDKLFSYVNEGGTLVIGPGIPYLDRCMKKYSPFDEYEIKEGTKTKIGNGCVIYAGTANALDFSMLQVEANYKTTNDKIELVVQNDTNREFLFAANVSDTEQNCTITFNDSKTFKAKWNSSELIGKDFITITMQPYSVSVWEVI